MSKYLVFIILGLSLLVSSCSTVELSPIEKECVNKCEEHNFNMRGYVDDEGTCRCRQSFQPKERFL